MDYETILLETEDRMSKALEVLQNEYRGMRTGRANPGLVENIRVEYYGAPTPLKQLANISAPEPDLLLIKPFDPSVVGEIDKAIQRSDVGITPAKDGKVIRLSIPALSEERRSQLVNRAKESAEASRVSVRNIRRDANRSCDELKKASKISEDDQQKLKEEIQNLTNDYGKRVDELLKRKTEDLMEI